MGKAMVGIVVLALAVGIGLFIAWWLDMRRAKRVENDPERLDTEPEPGPDQTYKYDGE